MGATRRACTILTRNLGTIKQARPRIAQPGRYTPLVPRPEGGAFRIMVAQPPTREAGARRDVPTSVYLYYDKNDVLLYVGITSRATKRQQEHNTDKEWWQYVAKQAIEHFASRPEALARESELIRQFRPPFNKQQNPDHEAMREMYMAYRAGDLTQATSKRHVAWIQHSQDPDGRNTVLRTASMVSAQMVYTAEGLRAQHDKRKYGAVKRIWRQGPFLFAEISGTMPPVIAARSRVKRANKPVSITIETLYVEVAYHITSKKELKKQRYWVRSRRRNESSISAERAQQLVDATNALIDAIHDGPPPKREVA